MGNDRVCCYCGVAHGLGDGKKELRPYGPGGAWLCFPCMKSGPERRAEAERQFESCLNENGKRTGAVLLTNSGVIPAIIPRSPTETKNG